eukprot:scaffold180266_cov26-Tisochrysis_lutea.AAC.1
MEASGDDNELRALYEQSADMERRSLKLSKLHNLQQLRRNRGQRERAKKALLWTAAIAVAVVAYFAKNILLAPNAYPVLRDWWASARRERRRYAPKGANMLSAEREPEPISGL